MKNLKSKHCLALAIGLLTGSCLFSQNSVLVNFGSLTCSDFNAPAFSMIKNPLTAAPSVMASCDLKAQQTDIFSVFVAFNPRNNKLYIADNRSGIKTNIWVLDIGLPGVISCPASIPVTPTYSYNYVSNNFEFDNNGDLWSLSNYNPTTGQCSIDKFDVLTGNVINTRILQFPAGHFPTAVTSGDITIAPNGRMFATLGSYPSQLYEITNYNSATPASATYLQTLPLNCFGLAYLDGKLEITGFDQNFCYYFDYEINTNNLHEIHFFQNGQSPVDNTAFTPALGTTKQVISATKIDATTADIVYEIFVRNMGNVILNNINITDDLVKTFGAGNVSNVSASFVPGANGAGLTLNPAYNGTTVTSVLNPNQQLPNQNATNNDYYFKVQISCRVSNLNPATIYYNSAIGKATINNAIDPINVADSSNNGTEAVVDPDKDGNASGPGENVPTPFNLGTLPVHFIKADAILYNNTSSSISWTVATPVVNAAFFEPEFSTDGYNWTTLAKIPIGDKAKSTYEYRHGGIPGGTLYYRIKQTDLDGKYIYSRVILIQRKSTDITYRVYPNPANQSLSISAPSNSSGKTIITLYDVLGRSMITKQMQDNSIQMNTADLPVGTYLLKITNNNQTTTEKVLIRR